MAKAKRSDVYVAEHSSKKVVKAHLKKIKARGGDAVVDGMTIEYDFPAYKKKKRR